VELAVVSMDKEKAAGIKASGNASISAGVVVANFDSDALAGDPGAVLSGVRGPRFEVRGEAAEFGVEGEENGGG
jgi:hypothetical protein